MTGVSFYYFLWRLISVRRVRASNGRQNRFLYRSHRNGQSRKNIVFMRLCGVSGIHFLRRGEQIILLFFMIFYWQSFATTWLMTLPSAFPFNSGITVFIIKPLFFCAATSANFSVIKASISSADIILGAYS